MPLPIVAPALSVPLYGVAFGTLDADATAVGHDNPLPVTSTVTAAASTPLVGNAGSPGTSAAFHPDPGREIVLTLSGDWSGTVSLLRSIDAGVTKLPATIGGDALQWAGSLNEVVWVETEAGATLYLQLAPISGTIAYRVAQ